MVVHLSPMHGCALGTICKIHSCNGFLVGLFAIKSCLGHTLGAWACPWRLGSEAGVRAAHQKSPSGRQSYAQSMAAAARRGHLHGAPQEVALFCEFYSILFLDYPEGRREGAGGGPAPPGRSQGRGITFSARGGLRVQS